MSKCGLEVLFQSAVCFLRYLTSEPLPFVGPASTVTKGTKQAVALSSDVTFSIFM